MTSATKPGVLDAIPRDIVAACDYERHARLRLDINAWEFLDGGAADEITLRENRSAFESLRLKTRALANVRGGHTRLELFGSMHEHPILLAPVAYQKLFHPEGELAAAAGAAAMAATMVISSLASTRLEDVAQHAHARPWFQLYLQRQREDTLGLVRRAEAAGYAALVVTVDAPLAGARNREQRAGFHLPEGIRAVNLDAIAPASLPPATHSIVFESLLAHAPTWDDIAWLAAATSLPVLLKGILCVDDAERAIDHGARGIIVSNHGGRVLDTVPATINALPAISVAVAGRVPVLMDGGIRRGTDIFKALALGADAVLIGRPYIHALASAGALGVAHLLRTLREELEIAMALCGCPTLDAIDDTVVLRRDA